VLELQGAQHLRISEVTELEFQEPGSTGIFFNYALLLKYNRNPKVEKMFLRPAF